MPRGSKTTSRARPNTRWRALFKKHLPGYDCVATAPEDCWFDNACADRAVSFFRDCIKHVKGELSGEPIELAPWQQALIGAMLGWKRTDGRRRYREVFCFVPRKNGKTCLAAGIIHLIAFTDHEPGAEIYSAAADRDQARLVFSQAKGMVHLEPEFSARAQVYTNSIVYPDFVSYKALSAEAGTKHGLNTHLAVIDELHAQPDRELVDVLATSTGSRRQPIIFYITTSDYEREGSICNEKHDYASKVRDGIIDDPSFLPVIYEAIRDDDWTDPKVWAKANPNLGISLSEEYLERECKRAIESPAFENTFKRLHLNIRTEQDVRFLPMTKWDECAAAVDPGKLEGATCYAGLDLASTTDVAALVLLFPDHGNAVLPFFWVPEDNARERQRKDRVPYIAWAQQGLVTLTEGNVVDQAFIRQQINDLKDRFEIVEIAVDPWNSIKLQTELQQDGFEIIAFRQGFSSMTSPTKELEALVLSKKIKHAGHPVLRWMASNVSVEMDPAGNLKPSKKKSSEKIDGIVALIMALGQCMLRQGDGTSVYEKRGILMV